VDSVTRALRTEGILEEWTKQADGYHLLNASCPYHRAARASSGRCCDSERRAIALLLDAEVEQIGRIAEGGPCCEYVVHAAP
jgi:predicted ArsR family transcriptional regulator